MEITEQINPIQKHDRLVTVSFILGVATMIFPIISIVYLVTVNGGLGYLQSLFCGIPVAFISIITGVVSLAQRRRSNQKGHWMATVGIVLGSLFYVTLLVMVFILLFPFLSGVAH
jgi:uncharacterized membrane protein